jgi:L-aminoadipate-semialdehyde dehydrogenase
VHLLLRHNPLDDDINISVTLSGNGLTSHSQKPIFSREGYRSGKPAKSNSTTNQICMPTVAQTAPSSCGSVMALLKELYSNLLPCSLLDVQDDADLTHLSSRNIVVLLLRLSKMLGVKLPMTFVFQHRTMSKAAQTLHRIVEQPDDKEAWAFAEEQSGAAAVAQDAQPVELDPVTAAAICNAQEATPNFDVAGSCFLTGATGCVGQELFREILGSWQRESSIYVLIRAGSQLEANGRLRALLPEEYEELPECVVPVLGDLSQQNFGMSNQAFDAMARDVTAVYHFGAVVDHVSPHDKLHTVNVAGTAEVLRFASLHQLKFVHFASTVATTGLDNGIVR